MIRARVIRRTLVSLAILWFLLATVARALPTVAGVDHGAASSRIMFEHAVDSRADSLSPLLASPVEAKALDEMLRGSKGQVQRWAASPELVVLGSVMEYRGGDRADYLATAETLTEAEIDQMVDDLTAALALLTGNAFGEFSAVTRERPVAGSVTRVTRPNQIIVGRYQGVRTQLNTIGLGGRASRSDGTITAAAILLDEEFDRTNTARRLLRTHELGHALGYNHVQSRISIMNPRIGPEPTDFDRKAALIAFQK